MIEQVVTWLRQQVELAGAKGLVVGLSGGVDSSVVARLAQLAMGLRVVGVILPIQSDPRDESDAQLVADQFALPVVRIDLGLAHLEMWVGFSSSGLVGQGAPSERVVKANMKPRLRMTMLYAIANHLNFLVAGTGNRSEAEMGYFTKYGDGGVDVLPLGRLVKSQVYALARDLDVPASIIEKPPSAGLWAGQTDEGEMGFTYDDLEQYLTHGASAVRPEVAAKMMALAARSAHKRGLPPVFDPR